MVRLVIHETWRVETNFLAEIRPIDLSSLSHSLLDAFLICLPQAWNVVFPTRHVWVTLFAPNNY